MKSLHGFDVLTPWRMVRNVSTVVLTCLPLVLVLDLMIWTVHGTFLVFRAGDWGIQAVIGLVALCISVTSDMYPKSFWMLQAAARQIRLNAVSYDVTLMRDQIDTLTDLIDQKNAEIAELRHEVKVLS